MPFPYEEFDLSHVRTYPLAERSSKARAVDFARPSAPGASFASWFDSLPAILGAADVRRVVEALVAARRDGRGIVWGIGAHVIKTGVSPVLIDLMQRGYVSALAMNGAGIIHDFEVALAGATSEDVDESLGPGRFGMAEETGTLLNQIAVAASGDGRGLGQAVGQFLSERRPPHADKSLAVAAHRHGVPLTVHVAVGTDITHMHPLASGAAIGDTSLRDFRYFTSSVARLDQRRVPELRIRGGAAGDLPQGGGAGAQSRHRAGGHDDRQHRLSAAVSPYDERRDPPGGRYERHGHLARRPPRDPDSRCIAAAVLEREQGGNSEFRIQNSETAGPSRKPETGAGSRKPEAGSLLRSSSARGRGRVRPELARTAPPRGRALSAATCRPARPRRS